jgi:uncharacterized protein YcnI
MKALHTVIALGLALVAMPAIAHVTMENREATVGASYKGVLKVPHGCEKSATVSVRVKIPEGVIGVKPMPKPGWTLTTVTGKYAKSYKMFHGEIGEGVTEIAWSGGKLPDEWYEEFTFQGFVASDLQAGKTIYFPVVQECEKGVHRWIEIPAEGKTGADYREPAPAVKLVPASAPRH